MALGFEEGDAVIGPADTENDGDMDDTEAVLFADGSLLLGNAEGYPSR